MPTWIHALLYNYNFFSILTFTKLFLYHIQRLFNRNVCDYVGSDLNEGFESFVEKTGM